MYRVRLIVAAAIAASGTALAGCSGSSISMPDWLTFKPLPPAAQPLQFESQPPGAEVHTAQGLTCRTPCSLAVPLTNQPITFAMDGYAPQTVQVNVHQAEHVAFDNSTPAADFAPNPVEVALEPVKSKKPKQKSRKSAATTQTAARTVASQPSPGTIGSAPADPFPTLQPAPASSPYPPPSQVR